MSARIIEMATIDYNRVASTIVLTIDEAETEDDTAPKTGTLNVKERTSVSLGVDRNLYDPSINFSYDDEGNITITDTTADAQEFIMDDFIKISYKNQSISLTFDLGGYLRVSTAADGWTSAQRSRIPYFTIEMNFHK
jgi:hypothetical protein